MQAISVRVFRVLAWLVLAGLVLEVYLAGAGLFGAVTFQLHRAFGLVIAVAILLFLVMVLVARPGRRAVSLTGVLAILTVVQVFLPSARNGLPGVAALHAVNAVVLVVVTLGIVLRGTTWAVNRPIGGRNN